jgi:hypothetical protein
VNGGRWAAEAAVAGGGKPPLDAAATSWWSGSATSLECCMWVLPPLQGGPRGADGRRRQRFHHPGPSHALPRCLSPLVCFVTAAALAGCSRARGQAAERGMGREGCGRVAKHPVAAACRAQQAQEVSSTHPAPAFPCRVLPAAVKLRVGWRGSVHLDTPSIEQSGIERLTIRFKWGLCEAVGGGQLLLSCCTWHQAAPPLQLLPAGPHLCSAAATPRLRGCIEPAGPALPCRYRHTLASPHHAGAPCCLGPRPACWAAGRQQRVLRCLTVSSLACTVYLTVSSLACTVCPSVFEAQPLRLLPCPADRGYNAIQVSSASNFWVREVRGHLPRRRSLAPPRPALHPMPAPRRPLGCPEIT